MFFKEIRIENFRGIESLIINNIKQVNLITGRNNCGKTSVLEAVFLLTGMSNPQLPVLIHNFRDLSLTDDEDFSYFFNKFDISNNPKINGKSDSQERTLEIKAIYSAFSEIPKQISTEQILLSNSSDVVGSRIEGLNLIFNLGKEKTFQSEIRLKQNEIKVPRDYKEKLVAYFINPGTVMKDMDRRLNAILIRKDLGTIINSLKEIEPQLLDIRMGAGGVVYADIGVDRLIPINVMGDGIRRILAMLAAISERKNGILLIDEIENGLHYTTLSILWKAILKAASDNNVQLFITTHSYECVQAIAKTYQDQKAVIEKDFISLFRIEKNSKSQHRAFQYTADTLIAGIEKEFEVR